MEFFRIHRDIPFMRHVLALNAVSILAFVLAMYFLATRGLHLSIEFTGGTLVEVQYAQTADLERTRASVEGLNLGEVQVQNFGTSRDVLIRVPVRGEREQGALSASVFEALCRAEQGTVSTKEYTTPQGEQVSRPACTNAAGSEPLTLTRTEFVGPSVGEELYTNGALALAVTILGIMAYLAMRFEWKFSIAGIVANLHDVIIILGFFAFFQWEFSLAVLAAVLAVLPLSGGFALPAAGTVVLSDAELSAKFMELASSAIGSTRAEKLLAELHALDRRAEEMELVVDHVRQFLAAAAGVHDDEPRPGFGRDAGKRGVLAQPPHVVDDVRAGGYPDVLGQDPGQGQHHARGTDDHDALNQVPVIGRQVDQAEEQGRDHPGAEDGALAPDPQPVRKQRQDRQEGQQRDHLFPEQLRHGLGEVGDAPGRIQGTQLGSGGVGCDVGEGGDDSAHAHADHQVQQGKAQHQPQFAPADPAEDRPPVAGRNPRQRQQRNQREQHRRDQGPERTAGPGDRQDECDEPGHDRCHHDQPLPGRERYGHAVVEGEVAHGIFQPPQALPRRQRA